MGRLEYYGEDYNKFGYLELRRCGRSTYCIFWLVLISSYLALGMEGFDPFVSGGIASHHIAVGTLGILACLFHLSVRPPQHLFKGLRMEILKYSFSIV
ncbi:hypothetical protein Goshw_011771 [Gossypium schwendimanii]|uniref:Uncharacterized protein n=1 Tax=Gossypium schwendimanii TaxID=34291 RepID=A0A7J9N856_GOSSC|nr:hypothetical protein [Gossypium schwendimanii]